MDVADPPKTIGKLGQTPPTFCENFAAFGQGVLELSCGNQNGKAKIYCANGHKVAKCLAGATLGWPTEKFSGSANFFFYWNLLQAHLLTISGSFVTFG